MFKTLVHPSNITSESVKVFTFENENGEQLEALRGYLASKEINGKVQKYFIDENIYDSMPIRVNQFEEIYLKESPTKKSILHRPLTPTPFRIRAEKTFETTRRMIDEIAPFEHTNPDAWTLMKIIAIMGVAGKIFVGISSNSECGKSGIFQVIHGLTQKSVVYQPRTEAGVLIQINEDGNMVFDEIGDCLPPVKKLVGAFTLKVADNSPTYVNGAIKAKFLKQIYNITQQSVTFLFNVKEYYKNPDEDFFDSMFGNNPAIHSRMLKLKFDGKLLEHFGKDFDMIKCADDNKMFYIRIAKHILWLKNLRVTNSYKKRYSYQSANKPKGRKGLIYEEITWLLDMYCQSEEEYRKLIGVLDKAIEDYRIMAGQQPLVSQSEQNNLIDMQEVKSWEVKEEEVMDIPELKKQTALEFMEERKLCDIGIFLEIYPQKELERLLNRGEVFMKSLSMISLLG